MCIGASRYRGPVITLVAIAAFTILPVPARGQVVDLRNLDLPRWRLEEDFRLGSVDGEHDAFDQLGDVRADDRGDLYVLDVTLPALRVFDAGGTFLRQIGHAGDGPGEYRTPVRFGFLGDTIWVIDGRTEMITYYDHDGAVIEAFRIAAVTESGPPPHPVGVRDAEWFLAVTPKGPPPFSQLGEGPVTFDQSIIVQNRSGTSVDTIASYQADAGLMIVPTEMGRSYLAYQPIRDERMVVYRPQRDQVIEVERPAAREAEAGEFSVRLRHPDGTPIQKRTFDYRPVAIPGSVRDSIRDEFVRSHSQGATADARKAVEAALDYIRIPEYVPPVSSILGANDGTRWIGRERFPGVASGGYLITDAGLNPLATVDWPAGAFRRIGPITHDHIWFVEKDELDVQYLVRYRIHR